MAGTKGLKTKGLETKGLETKGLETKGLETKGRRLGGDRDGRSRPVSLEDRPGGAQKGRRRELYHICRRLKGGPGRQGLGLSS